MAEDEEEHLANCECCQNFMRMEKRYDDLKDRLDKINKIIYAAGLQLGSAEYFEVRGLCTEYNKTKGELHDG